MSKNKENLDEFFTMKPRGLSDPGVNRGNKIAAVQNSQLLPALRGLAGSKPSLHIAADKEPETHTPITGPLKIKASKSKRTRGLKEYRELIADIREAKERETEDYAPSPTPQSNAVAKRANPNHDPNNPMQAGPAAYLHKRMSRAWKNGVELDHHRMAHLARVAWAGTVMHLHNSGQEDMSKVRPKKDEFKTENGGTYRLSRLDNAKMALADHEANRNSTHTLYHHLVHHGVSHEDAEKYIGYDYDHGKRMYDAFREGRVGK